MLPFKSFIKDFSRLPHAVRPLRRMSTAASLSNKNVAVVGASRGIGLEVGALSKILSIRYLLFCMLSPATLLSLLPLHLAESGQAGVRDDIVGIVQFVRQLLARGNTVHATARRPEQAKELQDIKTQQLSITSLDTSEPDTIRHWAAQLQGQKKFDVSSCLTLIMHVCNLLHLSNAHIFKCLASWIHLHTESHAESVSV